MVQWKHNFKNQRTECFCVPKVLEGISKRVEVLPANEESLPDIEVVLGWVGHPRVGFILLL